VRRRALFAAGLLGVLLAPVGCSTFGERDEAPSADLLAPGAPATPPGESGEDGADRPAPGNGPSSPAPEREVESSFRAPIVTGKYVWSANPDSGKVALIDAATYEVRAVEAGFGPTHVAAVERADGLPRALVINSRGHDATLLELAADDVIRTRRVALHQGADSWSVSPDGRFAIAWSDSRNAAVSEPTDGFQDVTVIELAADGELAATRLTVGYRPASFAFAGTRAFGVTQDGISVIELAGDVRLSALVQLPGGARVQPDVSISPDGVRALARIEGSAMLYEVTLASGAISEHELGGRISDLDLSADGTMALAVVQRPEVGAVPDDAGAGVAPDAGDAGADAGAVPEVESGESEALFIPLPAGLADASLRRSLRAPAQSFGSVVLSGDGQRAVLFSTGRASGRVTVVDRALTSRNLDLIAAVRAVFVTPDGAHALALQTPPAGSVRRGAFSVFSLADVRAPKLVASDAPAETVALLPDGSDRALVSVSEPGSYGAYLVRMPNLQVDFNELPSRPLATGMIPSAGKGFVAQAHPEGRITFIDLADGEGREITGFELSSKVVAR
jgi:hypothetical protein